MIVERLEWDSNFFGFDVYCLVLEPGDTASDLREKLKKVKSKVCYIYVAERLRKVFNKILSNEGALCFDNKITFVKKLSANEYNRCELITEAQEITTALEKLAYDSGWCSRFNVDLRFRPYFKRLYYKWLQRDLLSDAGLVFEIVTSNKVCGMVTLSVSEKMGRIGLLAVKEGCRGLGYGQKLMMAAETYCLAKGAECLKVVTQLNNKAACQLYERSGFQVESMVDVWHLWKD